MLRDVQYAVRTLRRSPGFVVVAVFVLGLGIGAVTAIFSLINAVLFQPLPVVSPDTLRFVYERRLEPTRTASYTPYFGIPYRDYEVLRDRHDLFAGVAGRWADRAKFGGAGDTEQVAGETVSANYFDVLGVKPALGRAFTASDDDLSAAPAIVISDSLWRRRFQADTRVIGTEVDLRATSVAAGYYSAHRRAYTIIGVMPAGFRGLTSPWEPAEFWTSLFQRASDHRLAAQELRPNEAVPALEDDMWVVVVLRLGEGITDEQARVALLAAERHMLDRLPPTERRTERKFVCLRSLPAQRMPFDTSGKIVPERLALALMAVTAFVLLIAVTNLTGLVMARGVARRGDVAVRLALGASRGRVLRYVLAESVVLSFPAAGVGLLLARVLTAAFLACMPSQIGGGLSLVRAISLDVPIDLRVLAFTAAVGIGAGLLVGLAPVTQALKVNLLAALSGGVVTVNSQARGRIRHWIVVPQVCLSLALLLCAGVLVRTLLNAELVDRGFDPNHLVYAYFELPQPDFRATGPTDWAASGDRRRLLYARLLERVRSTPGVTAAALALLQPWDGRHVASVVSANGYAKGRNHWVKEGDVGTGYFETMGIKLLRGRTFDGRDTAATIPVAVVCERLAELLWPGQDAVGQYIARYDPKYSAFAPAWQLVVGVVREAKAIGREDQTLPFIYVPLEQQKSPYVTTLVVRGRGREAELKRAVTDAIVHTATEVEIPRCATMTETIGEVLYPRRVAAAILALAGLIGLLLSSVGLYGLVSYAVAQRVREIGIRAALGARRADLVWLMLHDGALMLAAGLMTGIALAFAAIRVTSSAVVALPAMDVLTLAGVVAILTFVTLAASYVPARRAGRVNPVDVLRGL